MSTDLKYTREVSNGRYEIRMRRLKIENRINGV